MSTNSQLSQKYTYRPKYSKSLLRFLFMSVLIGFLFLVTQSRVHTGNDDGGVAPVPNDFLHYKSIVWAVLLAMTGVFGLFSWAFNSDRVTFPILEREEMFLPTGLFQLQMTKVSYTDITRLWETNLRGVDFLHLQVGRRRLDINSVLLPSRRDYARVKSFLAE
jgi:hypothetical protein